MPFGLDLYIPFFSTIADSRISCLAPPHRRVKCGLGLFPFTFFIQRRKCKIWPWTIVILFTPWCDDTIDLTSRVVFMTWRLASSAQLRGGGVISFKIKTIYLPLFPLFPADNVIGWLWLNPNNANIGWKFMTAAKLSYTVQSLKYR